MYIDQFQSGRVGCLNTARRYRKNTANTVISFPMTALVKLTLLTPPVTVRTTCCDTDIVNLSNLPIVVPW